MNVPASKFHCENKQYAVKNNRMSYRREQLEHYNVLYIKVFAIDQFVISCIDACYIFAELRGTRYFYLITITNIVILMHT